MQRRDSSEDGNCCWIFISGQVMSLSSGCLQCGNGVGSTGKGAKLCPTHHNPMDNVPPGLPVLYHSPESMKINGPERHVLLLPEHSTERGMEGKRWSQMTRCSFCCHRPSCCSFWGPADLSIAIFVWSE
ncbi:uncharacterized protein LOC143841200 [Paroedura picta]|uniref:uncharacterized protein LOC143841200 n=1 Tax=Paroedura picta TaxID=143630 RepID=UPI0040577F0A